MKRWPPMGVVLAGLWVFVRGASVHPYALFGEFLIGLVVGLPVAFVFRRFYTSDLDVTGAVKAIPLGAVYVVLFLWELATANFDVAYRVLHPRMPINPDVVEVPLRVQSDLAITTIANSITLTPGTLTMDYDDDRHALYVHSIAARDPQSVIDPIRTWEDYALRMFDEPLDPTDPVPQPGDEVEQGGGSDGE